MEFLGDRFDSIRDALRFPPFPRNSRKFDWASGSTRSRRPSTAGPAWTGRGGGPGQTGRAPRNFFNNMEVGKCSAKNRDRFSRCASPKERESVFKFLRLCKYFLIILPKIVSKFNLKKC